jgi:hypothetical protein
LTLTERLFDIRQLSRFECVVFVVSAEAERAAGSRYSAQSPSSSTKESPGDGFNGSSRLPGVLAWAPDAVADGGINDIHARGDRAAHIGPRAGPEDHGPREAKPRIASSQPLLPGPVRCAFGIVDGRDDDPALIRHGRSEVRRWSIM